jgi:RHS repeat-associated protein
LPFFETQSVEEFASSRTIKSRARREHDVWPHVAFGVPPWSREWEEPKKGDAAGTQLIFWPSGDAQRLQLGFGFRAYTGRELDVETWLQYTRARYYDAFTGRWISEDPLGFDAGGGEEPPPLSPIGTANAMSVATYWVGALRP